MAKKTFSNPVEMFLTQPQPQTEPATGGDQGDRLPKIPRQTYTTKKPLMRRAKEGQEPRDRRVQLLFRQSVFIAVRDIANRERVSFNHMVEAMLTAYIDRYNAEREADKGGDQGADRK